MKYSAVADSLWPGYTDINLAILEDPGSTTNPDPRPENHSNLAVYPESQGQIAKILTDIAPPFSAPLNPLNQQAAIPDSRMLLVSGRGPIDLLLVNSNGQRLGYDPTTGQIVNEIPTGVYAHLPGAPADITVFDPFPGPYGVSVLGTTTGEYTIVGQYADADGSVSVLYQTGSIQAGQVQPVAFVVPTASTDVATPPDVVAGSDLQTVAGTPVTFSVRFKDINPNDTHTILWNFGDGGVAANTLTPTHTYTLPGIYTVTLTVLDSAGFSITDTLQVTVTPP